MYFFVCVRDQQSPREQQGRKEDFKPNISSKEKLCQKKIHTFQFFKMQDSIYCC